MRKLVYSVAMSLDGFIAGPHGEYDWITHDPSIDFAAIFRQFDTLLMGRRTYEAAMTQGQKLTAMGMKVVVVSTTLTPTQHRGVTIISGDVPAAISALKAEPGKDIWLFGGGALCRGLLDAALVDAVEVAVMPVLLGSGVPLVPEGRRAALHLQEIKALPTGILMLKYSVSPRPQSA